ncbi:ABC transporter substrate-binding protein [Leekyejoonella antrihumi]|nr:ABC transporter substrate-binding protein [Leekyejoonella antrihumi]
MISLVTEPLERVSSTGQVSPNLATAVSQPNATTLVYTIRSGVKFSDGTPLTAKDVAWSIKHVTSPPAQTAGDVGNIGSVKVTGPLQVTVKLTKPDPATRAKLAVITYVQEAKFAKAHAKELGTRTALPVGTGPYKFSSDTTSAVTLAANPHYWGKRPSARKVVFTFIDNDTSAQLAMRSGSIDGTLISDPKAIQQWKSIDGATLYETPSLESTYIALNTSIAPFNDPHVRKAFAYSIDRTGLLKAAFGNNGAVLHGLVPAGVISDVAPSTSAAKSFLKSLPGYDFSPTKAAAELAQSKHPKGFTVTVPYISSTPFTKLTALNLQQNMQKLGVKINLKSQTQNQWLTSVYGQKNPGAQFMTIVADVPDPNGLLSLVVGKANTAPQHFNTTNWTTPQIETALPVMESSSSNGARWKATKTILSQIAGDAAYIPLFSPDNATVLAKGYTFTNDGNLFTLINGSWIFDLKASR